MQTGTVVHMDFDTNNFSLTRQLYFLSLETLICCLWVVLEHQRLITSHWLSQATRFFVKTIGRDKANIRSSGVFFFLISELENIPIKSTTTTNKNKSQLLFDTNLPNNVCATSVRFFSLSLSLSLSFSPV